MQTQTGTSTSTFTNARHIASKVAADLKRLQRVYGINSPDDTEIYNYQTEMVMLLDEGYVWEVTYGFKRDEKWVIALKYRAAGNVLSSTGGDPGGIRPTENIRGAHFTSFLAYSLAWMRLSEQAKRTFQKSIPIQRVDGIEPSLERGSWAEDRNYLSGTLGVQRYMIRRY